MHTFIAEMPKAELHVHLEGTIEPDHIFELAERNAIELEYDSPEAILAAYDFDDLPSFLKIYYAGMNVLRTEEDFYDLTYRFFQKAAEQNIVYAEPFFDPQAHTIRGVDFATVITGIHRAQVDAATNLGVESNLILCFLRDMSAESAMDHLNQALPFREWFIGVGLDSDEQDNPPRKFAEVFARAREEGLKLTMHCDVNQENAPRHIRECLTLIEVDRIDHGVNALDDENLWREIGEKQLGLTVCPVSNQVVVQSLTGDAIRTMLQRGMKATINSDDPAYFRAYLNENFQRLVDEAGFTRDECLQLARNAFEASWLDTSRKRFYLDKLADYASATAA